MNLQNILYSGFSFNEQEDLFKFRIKLLNSIFVIAIATTLLFATLSLLGINPYNTLDIGINLYFTVTTLILLLILRSSKRHFTLVTHIFLFNNLLVYNLSLIYVPEDSFRMIWFFALVYLAFVFEGSKTGFFYTFLSIFSIFIYETLTEYPDPEIAIHSALVGLVVMSFLFHVNSQKFLEHEKTLEAKSKILSELVSTDALTGISNRYYFDEQSRIYFDKVQKTQTNLTLILLDIDYFKRINDTYGHLAGDKVLIEFASVIKQSIDGNLIFARTGGEEFALLVNSMNRDEIRIFTEKLRKSIESFSFYCEEKKITLTVSIGIASYVKDDNTFLELYHRADKALYRAKDEGRNRTCFCLESENVECQSNSAS